MGQKRRDDKAEQNEIETQAIYQAYEMCPIQ